MRTVNERCGLEGRARFRSEAGPTIPSTVHWRLDCETSGTNLVGWTAGTIRSESNQFGLLNAWVDIDIPSDRNTMQSDANKRELKSLLIVADKDTDREYSHEVQYYVRNVKGRK